MAIINARSTYESPLTVVNTEANDVYLSALKRMGQVAADDLQRQKDQETARQKEANKWIQWTADNTLKNQGKAMDWMKEAGVNNPQLSSMIMEQINIMSELEGQARGASSPEEQRDLLRQVSEYKSRLASGMGVIGKMNDAITSYSEDAAKSPNAEGNINLSNPRALEWAQQMAIISGKNPGKSHWFIDEDNDWAIHFEGPQLKNPGAVKADVFFGYEPGIIPESTKDINQALNEIGFYDGDKVAAKFLMTRDAEGKPVPNYEYIDVGEGRVQAIVKTNMDSVLTNLVPTLHSRADGYASSYYEAEAYWDKLPKNIRDEVNRELKSKNMFLPSNGEDLNVGNFQQSQLDDKSLFAVRQAMVLQAKNQIRPFNVVGSPVKKETSPGGSNDSKSNNNNFSSTTNTFIDKIKNTPIKEIIQQFRNADTNSIMDIDYNEKKNQVVITDGDGEKITYDLDSIKDFDVEAIASETGDAGQFFMRWLNTTLGNTEKERKIKSEVSEFLAAREVKKNTERDPNSGNIPYYLLNPDGK